MYQIVFFIAAILIASVAVYDLAPHLLNKMIVVSTVLSMIVVSAVGWVPGVRPYSLFGLADPKILIFPAVGSLVTFVLLRAIYIFNHRTAAS